jgi:hypothetical protein
VSACRWNAEASAYLLPDGDPCKTDEYGDPTNHCTMRRTCSQHVGWGELTCARCIGRVRTDIRQIVQRAALMLPEAMARGTVECEAANLAGPAADPVVTSWRRINASRQPGLTINDGIEEHADPTDVLGSWQFALSEDYGHDLPDRVTLTTAVAYLERNLHIIAQDDEQDFPLLARELRKCRAHLEAVLRDSMAPERGAPCPTCHGRGTFVRLARWYPHWCDAEDCEQFHWDTDEQDRWVCPRDKAHSWDLESYSKWVEERKQVGA